MKKIVITEAASGFELSTEGRPIKTPLGRQLILPNRKLAEAVAEEWATQGKTIRKETMPLSQIACVAIDLVREKRNQVYEDIMAYSDTDLVCYRAGGAPELQAIQTRHFDPLIEWAERVYHIKCNITNGVMPVRQPPENKQRILYILKQYDEWRLAVLVSVIKPLSSLIFSLAFIDGRIDAGQAFHLSHLEERYETEKWGKDEEKEKRINRLGQEIAAADEFLKLLS